MPLVTITGLKTPANVALATNPSIDTSPPFDLTSATYAPGNCGGIKNLATVQTSVNNFLLNYGISATAETSLTTKLTNLKTQLDPADQGQLLTEKPGYDDTQISGSNVKAFITSLQNSYLPMIRLVDTCMRENVEVDQSALIKAKDTLNESKTRYESIVNPERNVSYYEGWFPIVRPMSEPALFGLFGAAIFMLLVSILIFLRLSGVQLEIQIPESTFALPPNASYYMYGGAAAGIIGAVAYGYMRK
jgi:hypothetical protein